VKKFFEEFKAFAMRGNVIDMAVGVVIGGAFGKITTSVVNDIIMPLISMLTGGIDYKMHDKLSKPAEPESEKAPEPTKEEVLLTEIRDLLKEQSK